MSVFLILVFSTVAIASADDEIITDDFERGSICEQDRSHLLHRSEELHRHRTPVTHSNQ